MPYFLPANRLSAVLKVRAFCGAKVLPVAFKNFTFCRYETLVSGQWNPLRTYMSVAARIRETGYKIYVC
jgi:hypothetical protein